jgi:NitT/TauT family transport system ATP-binding protein
MAPCLEWIKATVSFGENKILESISLRVERGEFISILGPSGCGKSTLLKVAAQLQPLTTGQYTCSAQKTGFVFQEHTLLPWLNTQQNIELPLKIKGDSIKNISEKSHQLLSMVGLAGKENYYPDQLSGGMRMRVSLARALALSPSLLLLDEPSGSLDDITRNQLNDTLVDLHHTLKFTALHVTHSVHEATYLADRVFILGGQPARVAKELKNPLPRPRRAEMRDSLEYHHFTVECAKALRLNSP